LIKKVYEHIACRSEIKFKKRFLNVVTLVEDIISFGREFYTKLIFYRKNYFT